MLKLQHELEIIQNIDTDRFDRFIFDTFRRSPVYLGSVQQKLYFSQRLGSRRMEQCTTTEICGSPVEWKEDVEETNPQVKVTVKVVRSSKFWFEDGNVVLQAERTQFRLHRSVLSMHCPIFRDMFACSLPENGPAVDGCPLIHFSETLEDVGNFVKILYRSIEWVFILGEIGRAHV